MGVNQYIGARYVPKFSDKNGGDWDNSYTYEALEIVKNGMDYYTAKIPVPTGVDISNTTYWVLTGNYNGAINSIWDAIHKIQADFSNIYNVADYGILPGNNVYDKLYDLIHDVVHPAGGGIIYFPKGRYTIDYSIFIPDNITILGDGDESEIFFDLTDTWFGCAICTAGSNIRIENIQINIDDNSPYNVRGALPNTIGISDIDYDAMVGGKRAHEEPRKSGNRNIYIRNVSALSSNYGVQIQPKSHRVGNIFIENFIIPTGMFSIAPNEDASIDNLVYNTFCKNIICDTFRFYGSTNNNPSIYVNGLVCTQIHAAGRGVIISDFVVNSGDGNRALDSQNHTCAIFTWGSHIFTNGKITKEATTDPFFVLQSSTNTSLGKVKTCFSNVIVEDLTQFSAVGVDSDSQSILMDNCNFNPYPATRDIIRNYTAINETVWPTYVTYNCDPMKSHIKAVLAYPGGTTAVREVARTDDHIASRTEALKDCQGTAILFKTTDPSVMEFARAQITASNGHIEVVRIITANSRSDFDAVAIDIVW